MSVYIWSDLHFYHDKIRLYENRPFESVEKMNQILCKNWKETVKGGTPFYPSSCNFYKFYKKD